MPAPYFYAGIPYYTQLFGCDNTISLPGAVAAGNPAKIVKTLNPSEIIIGREQWFSDPKQLSKDLDRIDREMLRGNSLFHWIRYLLFPRRND